MEIDQINKRFQEGGKYFLDAGKSLEWPGLCSRNKNEPFWKKYEITNDETNDIRSQGDSYFEQSWNRAEDMERLKKLRMRFFQEELDDLTSQDCFSNQKYEERQALRKHLFAKEALSYKHWPREIKRLIFYRYRPNAWKDSEIAGDTWQRLCLEQQFILKKNAEANDIKVRRIYAPTYETLLVAAIADGILWLDSETENIIWNEWTSIEQASYNCLSLMLREKKWLNKSYCEVVELRLYEDFDDVNYDETDKYDDYEYCDEYIHVVRNSEDIPVFFTHDPFKLRLRKIEDNCAEEKSDESTKLEAQ